MNAMIERLTLEELAQTLVQQSEVKQDYLVDSTRMVMEAYGGTPVLRVLDYSGGDCMEPLELTSTAHKQLGAYLKIPASYYDRMLREATDLLTTNVNNWLNRTAEVKLLRTMDGAARAVLSNRYWCVDHLNLLQMVIPVLGHMPGISVLDCGLSETRMYVKVTSERLKEDVVPGDTVQYGLIITNSEVGMGAITIQPYLYRLVCSNGMVSGERIGDGTRRIHKGCTMELNGPMQVSTRFSMAMHTLLCIGYFSGKAKTTSAFIASSVNANPVVIRRVLGQLKEADLVTVEAGVGGASLAKDPADITMLDVFRAVDSLDGGNLFDFHTHPNPDCPVGGHIHEVLDGELADAQAALEHRLAQTTLADLLKRLN